MSTSLVFYRVSRVQEDLPKVINTDTQDFTYAYESTDRASEWERRFGTMRIIEYQTVDVFQVAEQLFGARPSSYYCTSDYYGDHNEFAEAICHFSDGRKDERILKSVLNQHAYMRRYEAYVYQREELGYISDAYLFDYKSIEDRVLKKEDILQIAKVFMDEHIEDDAGEYYARPFFTLMKIYFQAKEDDAIVCIAD